ncbi:prepilin-type N-terminal cleavage/methylation domain-containing protein [Desulfobacula sp.]|uniref:PulJ/GspJ family protein n=1 Tax=Desulfobacula sp. TaxID=2593537 RepID=UPI0026179A7D|nr:prepilin-type N-terminal cleavage/methylation domain-containing protein [Desulfobacula sp.]
MTRPYGHKGFTLVEVLVAITIFAIAVSTLFASFNMVISNIDPINAGLDDYEMAQNAMDRIQKDLMSLCLTHDPAYTPPEMEGSDEPDRFRFVSKTVSLNGNTYTQLRFASFEHIGFKRGQKSRIGIIHYYVEPSENETMVLKRADIGSVFFEETRENKTRNDPLLCERVNAFELTFIDQEGKSHEEWDSDDANVDFATPYAIQIRLVIKNRERSNNFATTIVLPSHREKNES